MGKLGLEIDSGGNGEAGWRYINVLQTVDSTDFSSNL
jgi:hypothetical protein